MIQLLKSIGKAGKSVIVERVKDYEVLLRLLVCLVPPPVINL
jgi:hypothetical protein